MSSNSGRGDRLPWGALIGLGVLVTYQILAHRALSQHAAAAVWVPLVPLVVAVALAWRSRLRWLVTAVGLGLALWLWTQPARAPAMLLIIHLGAYLGLLWMFGRTLRAGQEPLVSRIARAVRGGLLPELAVYTRHVTQAWCVFFAAMALASCLLFLLAPLPVWSLLVNVLNVPLVALMFVGEYLWRITRYRHLQHYPLLAAVRAFRAGAGARDTLSR